MFNLFGLVCSLWCLYDSKTTGKAAFWLLFVMLNAFFLILNLPSSAHADNYSKLRQETVVVVAGDAEGSGVVFANGYVLTANHVVDGVDAPGVKFFGAAFEAIGKVVYNNKKEDYAIIQLPTSVPVASISCTPLSFGEPIVVVGNPLGLGWLISFGHIASNELVEKSYILLDVRMNHGNSGGPVFNERDELVGIADAVLSPMVEKGHISGEPIGVMVPTSIMCDELRKFNE